MISLLLLIVNNNFRILIISVFQGTLMPTTITSSVCS
jgi:hypothetical protein